MPESSLRAGSVTIEPPAELSKRVTRLNCRVGPPTSSHGIQMLYESPKLVLLWCLASCSGVKINFFSGIGIRAGSLPSNA